MRRRAFTLIELLVVVAMIAILAAIMMPSLTAMNGRARTITCESHLQEIGLALRMYVEDYGTYPTDLNRLLAGRYVEDPEALRCVKSGSAFVYHRPGPKTPPGAVLAACAEPTSRAPWPHEGGTSVVALLNTGKTKVFRRYP